MSNLNDQNLRSEFINYENGKIYYHTVNTVETSIFKLIFKDLASINGVQINNEMNLNGTNVIFEYSFRGK